MTEYAKGHAAGYLTAKRGLSAAASFKWTRDYRYGYSDGFAKAKGYK